MYRTKAFAGVLNSRGELVDLLWSESSDEWPSGRFLRPGEAIIMNLASLSQSGGCLGAADSSGYSVEYWVEAMTGTGQPLASYPSRGSTVSVA